MCVKGKTDSFIVSADTSDKKSEGKMCIPEVKVHLHCHFFLKKPMGKERKGITQGSTAKFL